MHDCNALRPMLTAFVAALLLVNAGVCESADFVDLFPDDGVPKGWRVTHWSNVGNPPPQGAVWKVEGGVLRGAAPRGTWLVSDREYDDFTLEFEFKLAERGNSGVGLRFPLAGDPAFSGLELQMIDPSYFGAAPGDPTELTGAFYRAVAPTKQLYKPGEWNRYAITCEGAKVTVDLNGERIQDVNLAEKTEPLKRGTPLAMRPKRGHLGFQELGRGAPVEIRGARLKELKPASP